MANNIDKFKKDLESLIARGDSLVMAMRISVATPEQVKDFKQELGDKADAYFKSLPKFETAYQAWYSESLSLLRQILPDRLDDFVRHYEKPKGRRDITHTNYTIEDYLQGTVVKRMGEVVVGQRAAVNRFEQQCAIVEAASSRFDSSLYDIRNIVHADLMDSEISTAKELNKHKFVRAAGAVAGVVLERHLREVCQNRSILPGKKNPTISDFNESLKSNDVIGVPDWRFIQHLADIRNLCDHSKDPEPTQPQVQDLIAGVDKIIKTVF
ncbi:hypothetical protein [uncultured Paraburkholderia sp.]|uniref:hypothetical protein n=1 Tax=uncultured Paraburkholderia sp. TaxID=1822466 RepID=UPI00259822DD|nr:hypothetical protein [uncultured Paraburkholderia sp.]